MEVTKFNGYSNLKLQKYLNYVLNTSFVTSLENAYRKLISY